MVAWGLDAGTGCGRTSINFVFVFLLPYTLYLSAVYFLFLLYFCLSCCFVLVHEVSLGDSKWEDQEDGC